MDQSQGEAFDSPLLQPASTIKEDALESSTLSSIPRQRNQSSTKQSTSLDTEEMNIANENCTVTSPKKNKKKKFGNNTKNIAQNLFTSDGQLDNSPQSPETGRGNISMAKDFYSIPQGKTNNNRNYSDNKNDNRKANSGGRINASYNVPGNSKNINNSSNHNKAGQENDVKNNKSFDSPAIREMSGDLSSNSINGQHMSNAYSTSFEDRFMRSSTSTPIQPNRRNQSQCNSICNSPFTTYANVLSTSINASEHSYSSSGNTSTKDSSKKSTRGKNSKSESEKQVVLDNNLTSVKKNRKSSTKGKGGIGEGASRISGGGGSGGKGVSGGDAGKSISGGSGGCRGGSSGGGSERKTANGSGGCREGGSGNGGRGGKGGSAGRGGSTGRGGSAGKGGGSASGGEDPKILQNFPEVYEVVKIKKRVVPTPVEKSAANTFTSSAFRAENNLLELSSVENVIDKRDITIMKREREAFKTEISNIAKEFEAQSIQQQQNLTNVPQQKVKKMIKINFEKITSKTILCRLISIYSLIIDLNLTPNVLSEISYCLNLLNPNIYKKNSSKNNDENKSSKTITENEDSNEELFDNDSMIKSEEQSKPDITDIEDYDTILKMPHNCVYFALGVLNKQKHLLSLFDLTTLKVILQNLTPHTLHKDFYNFIDDVIIRKTDLETKKSTHEAAFKMGQNFNNVFYQQDNDTRNNFPSDKEFTAFRKQRDQFYIILNIWKSSHLKKGWNFMLNVGYKVKALIALMQHPINMAHLAKLFTSQLIISLHHNESASELEIALPNVDLDKLSKLQQRLVAPSDFSTDYQFPGIQAFFRDFTLSADCSIVFIEQLKIALTAELMEMNDSSYEVFCLSSESDDSKFKYNEYVVRPETITTMRVLAKFLGLVITMPFNCDSIQSYIVGGKQIELRNMLPPTFDVMEILKKSIEEKKLLITIPWLVQYVSMLDYVTLHLNYYQQLIKALFELYTNLTLKRGTEEFEMSPTSTFILRSCLGWLFDNPNISEDFYKHRYSANNGICSSIGGDYGEITILVPKSLIGNFNSTEKIILSEIQSNGDELRCCLLKGRNDVNVNDNRSNNVPNRLLCEQTAGDACLNKIINSFDPLLENILNVSCPFLADFRVSIMPAAQLSKCVSRTGQYRYITTKISDPKSVHSTGGGGGTGLAVGGSVSGAMAEINAANDAQTKLSEAFLHSQSLSVRKIIEFVIERTTSAVIKDYQMEILIPSKENALQKIIHHSKLTDERFEFSDTQKYFISAHKLAMQKWSENLPVMIEKRVKGSLDALLPKETLDVIKQACTSLMIQKCLVKCDEWRVANLNGLDFYTKSLQTKDDIKKYMKRSTCDMESFVIDGPSKNFCDVLLNLQHLLHCSHARLNLVRYDELLLICHNVLNFLNKVKFPSAGCIVVGQTFIYLAQNLIRYLPEMFTNELLQFIINIWSNSKIKSFIQVKSSNDDKKTFAGDDYINSKDDQSTKKEKSKTLFDGLITRSFIESLETNQRSFNCLTKLLVGLVNGNLITIDFLNEQFVALFKIDWPDRVFNLISEVLKTVHSETKSKHPIADSDDDEKSSLFMEILSEFARDLDKF